MKDKTLICSRINLVVFPLVILYKIIGYKVFFLELQGFLKKIQNEKILKILNFIQLSYDDYLITNPEFYIDLYVNSVSKEYQSLLQKIRVVQELNKVLDSSGDNLNSLSIVATSFFNSLAIETSEVILFTKALKKVNGETPKILCKKNYISSRIIEISEAKVKNIEPAVFFYLELFTKFLIKIFSYFLAYIYGLKTKEENCNSSSIYSFEVGEELLGDYQVAYFPHNGLFYDSFYKKDQYYSDDKFSDLHPSKVLHFFNKDDAETIQKTRDYYESQGLNYSFFDSIKVSKKDIFYFSIKTGIKVFLKKFPKGTDLFFKLCVHLAVVNTYIEKKKISKLKKLKLVLYGYDVLFSKPISYALRTQNITTAASQERLFFPWGESSLIVDHYFTIGSSASREIQKNIRYDVPNIYTVGSPRVDNLNNQFCLFADRNKFLGDCHFLCVVFDMHSEKDTAINNRCYNNNWKSNNKFYKTIIKCAKSFPHVMFLIKGKNNNFLDIEYFSNTIQKINRMKNLNVFNEFNTYSPYYLGGICDFSIAIHTSVADELLQIGKPVLLLDVAKKGLPNKFIGYDENIHIKTHSELMNKINLILSGKFKPSVSENIFKFNQVQIKNRISNKLQTILNKTNED